MPAEECRPAKRGPTRSGLSPPKIEPGHSSPARHLDSATFENKIATSEMSRDLGQGMHDAGRDRLLADLRTRIARLERSPARLQDALPFGIAAIDDHLPARGLARGAIHEVLEAGATGEQSASAVLFVAGLAARLGGSVLWCLRRRDLFAPGLS